MPAYACKSGVCQTYLARPGYCDKHAHLAKAVVTGDKFYDQHLRDPESRKFYNSAAWKRCRDAKLKEDPFCERCKTAIALHVHHIKDIRSAPDLRLERSNLMSVCPSCHNAIEAEVKRNARTP